MGQPAGISWRPLEPRVDAGVTERNEMTIGRTDDPENPFGAPAFKAARVFGFGSRIPSGPAVMMPRHKGRTHDRNRPARRNSHFSSCIRRAVHTCTKELQPFMPEPMGGAGATIEADETWIGGKAENRAFGPIPPKVAVVSLVQRGGGVLSMITLIDGALVVLFDGLPASASRLL